MKLPRRRQFLHLAAGAAALAAVSRIARAQAYPSRPVRIVVPVAPGGALDIIARLMGQWLSDRLRQSFIIENRPGGGTNIGIDAVVHAPADGYTLLLIPQSVTANATFNRLKAGKGLAKVKLPRRKTINPNRERLDGLLPES